MDGDKIDNNTDEKKNGEDGVYEDFPKEIVHLLMKTHPINTDVEESEFPTMSSREEIRAARKHRLEEAKKEFTKVEKEAKVKRHEMVEKKTVPTEEFEKKDFNQTMAVIFDDDDEDMVQLVRHKSRKKGYEKGFSTKATAQFEEIEKTVKTERKPRPNRKKESDSSIKSTDTKENSKMPERKKIFDDEQKDNKSMLDSFFAENDENAYDFDEKKIKAKNMLIVSGIIVLLAFAVLFIKTISLTGKLNKAEDQIQAFEEVQEKNEELKLNVLTLEEEVGKLKSGEGENEAMPTDKVAESKSDPVETPETQQASSGEFDTYTIKKGDSYWTIAEEVYGNGVLYQKILDYNNLTETDPIKPGEVLKIPK